VVLGLRANRGDKRKGIWNSFVVVQVASGLRGRIANQRKPATVSCMQGFRGRVDPAFGTASRCLSEEFFPCAGESYALLRFLRARDRSRPCTGRQRF